MDVLSPARLGAAGCFEPKAVERLTAKCRNGKFIGFRDNMAFVGIVSTQLWHRAFMARAKAPAVSSAVA